MLLNSRPARAPLTHLERVRFMPTYDPNPSICLRSPPNVADPSSTLSDVTSAPVPTPNLCDPHRPKNPSPLRQVANTLEQPPRKLQHRLTLANLGTPGGKLVGFPRTCQQNLSAPKGSSSEAQRLPFLRCRLLPLHQRRTSRLEPSNHRIP